MPEKTGTFYNVVEKGYDIITPVKVSTPIAFCPHSDSEYQTLVKEEEELCRQLNLIRIQKEKYVKCGVCGHWFDKRDLVFHDTNEEYICAAQCLTEDCDGCLVEEMEHPF